MSMLVMAHAVSEWREPEASAQTHLDSAYISGAPPQITAPSPAKKKAPTSTGFG